MENEGPEQLQLEWLQEETSEPDDFIVVQSKKRKKESRRNLKISPNNRRGRKVQEDPRLPNNKGRKNINEYTKSNCRDLRKRGTSTLLKDLIDQCQFHFNGLQETMVENNEDSLIRKFDPQQNYL